MTARIVNVGWLLAIGAAWWFDSPRTLQAIALVVAMDFAITFKAMVFQQSRDQVSAGLLERIQQMGGRPH
ncbi:MAG TPA: hypothetical protein VM364_04660 [Vicinamibacterales bacterium]|nr:hypothetical protein [Vicinamibacterales bacterium]